MAVPAVPVAPALACTDNEILDLQHCTLSSQPMGTLTHLSTVQSTQPKAKTGMSIMYFNARSIMPKFDELCAIVQSSQPDIICIVESWLSSDIENKEIDIPGYVLHRLDRNRQGGGIVLYTSTDLDVNAITGLPSNLEFFVVSIRFLNRKICLGIFYRPPSSPSSIFDTFLQSLEALDIPQFYTFDCSHPLYPKLSTSQFYTFVCVGDFNIDCSHPLYPKLSTSQLLGLSQVVTGYTCFSLWAYLIN